MLKSTELSLLNRLRKNSRETLTSISFDTKIPISTLFDTLERLEKKVIIKHFSLIDFSKMGYNLRVNFFIKSRNRKYVSDFLLNHPNINSICLLDRNYDFYAECFFKNLNELEAFKSALRDSEAIEIKEMFVVEELKKEGFVI